MVQLWSVPRDAKSNKSGILVYKFLKMIYPSGYLANVDNKIKIVR